MDTITGWKLKYVLWIHIKEARKEAVLEKEVKRWAENNMGRLHQQQVEP